MSKTNERRFMNEKMMDDLFPGSYASLAVEEDLTIS